MNKHPVSALEKWTRIVDDFINSGLGPTAYCRKTGINANTLYAWRSRLGRLKELSSAGSEFQEITVSNETVPVAKSSPGSIEIFFSDKVKISLSSDIDEDLLLKTVRVLSRAIC